MAKFKLSENYIEKFKDKKPPFGFNGLGEITYLRTYSRIKDDGNNEVWWETVRRVVEGTYNMQKDWIEQHQLGWNPHRAQKSAQEMFDRMFSMKFLPPGRGLWAMGSAITEERKMYAALNNCAFVSTDNLNEEPVKPFLFMMDMSMLGVGVGFGVEGAGKITIKGPNPSRKSEVFEIPDSREGWVDSLKLLLESYFHGTGEINFDYSKIRAAGLIIKGFGGKTSGPEPLKLMHEKIKSCLDKEVGQPISITTIVDIMNLIGVCVVAGNVRRTAEIVFGPYSENEYLDLKNYKVNPERSEWGWTSNNSIFCDLGMDYKDAAERTKLNGEPGYAWLENMKSYSRMKDAPDDKDHRVTGGNPCFHGDTLIAVADGRGAVPIKELAESGNDVPVYSVTKEGLVEIQWARNPRKTRENVDLVRVELDDGTHLDVTPDHKFQLLNGECSLAKDLLAGDSLPRFYKTKQHIAKDSKVYYLRTHLDVSDIRTGKKKFEHRMIAEFVYPEKFTELYNHAKTNGWIEGGVVVHHKNYNSLDNSPENLQWMLFKDHCKLHADCDRNGEKNGMFNKTHSEESKRLIGDKTIERCQDPEYIERLKRAHGENRELYAESMRTTVNKKNKEYYIKQAETTDLKTVWVGERLYAVKNCIICNQEMTLEWGHRHGVFCSTSCANKKEENIQYRKAGSRMAFENRQRDVLHQQVSIFTELKTGLNRDPMKKEWEQKCRESGISYRLNKHSENPNILKNYEELKEKSDVYNHKVKSVTKLDGLHDVYNLTVDNNYTVGIVTKFDAEFKTCDGIFVFQCLEQSLESFELCCLVETFPHNCESLEDYLKTLKYAYLYAKTVTLGKTHWAETNRVMLRNRRIGCSMSGIAQFVGKNGLHTFKRWCEEGYKHIEKLDEIYSDWFAIPKSIKKTSIKPSGCQIPNSLIKTSEGVLSLYDIFKKNNIDLSEKQNEYRTWYDISCDIFVYDLNDDQKKITKLYVNGIEQTIKFEMEDGTFIECTPNHKFLMSSGEWKEAKDINESDDFKII